MTGASDHLLRIAAAVCVCTVLAMTYGVAVQQILSGVLPL
jgi:hypothetical protein